jgi:hypothetical protein
MSWNIQKMGAAKIDAEVTSSEGRGPRAFVPSADQTYILDYIVKVINLNAVDVIGVMEIMGNEGDWIKDQLLTKLKPEVWNGVVSSKQVGSPREEYLYLWKESSNILSLNEADPRGPSSASLINIIDDNSMAPLFKTIPLRNDQVAVYNALEWNGYIKNFNFGSDPKLCYRVNFDKWNALANQNADVVLDKDNKGNPLSLGLTQQQLDLLKDILVKTDIILFPVTGQRSPFLLNLNVNTGRQILPALFALFHAPGPPSGNKLETLRKSKLFDGINNIGLSTVLQGAPHMLLMGDFNVTADNRTAALKYGIYHDYSRRTNSDGSRFIFAPIGPIVKKDVFAAITGAPINAPCLIPDTVKTSITSTVKADTDINSVGASPYDKFFFKSQNDLIGQSDAGRVDLISRMNPDSKSLGLYDKDLAKTGVYFYKCRRSDNGLRSTIKKLTAENDVALQRLNQRVLKKRTLDESASTNASGAPSTASSKRSKINQADIDATTSSINATAKKVSALEDIQILLSPEYLVVPPSYNCAVEVFSAISDHLPISVSLSF